MEPLSARSSTVLEPDMTLINKAREAAGRRYWRIQRGVMGLSCNILYPKDPKSKKG